MDGAGHFIAVFYFPAFAVGLAYERDYQIGFGAQKRKERINILIRGVDHEVPVQKYRVGNLSAFKTKRNGKVFNLRFRQAYP